MENVSYYHALTNNVYVCVCCSLWQVVPTRMRVDDLTRMLSNVISNQVEDLLQAILKDVEHAGRWSNLVLWYLYCLVVIWEIFFVFRVCVRLRNKQVQQI